LAGKLGADPIPNVPDEWSGQDHSRRDDGSQQKSEWQA
jgi:hypothetical protein